MAITRDIMNISLPAEMANEVRREARAGGYSVSEYVRHIFRNRQREKLAADLHEDRASFDAGKGKVLRSLRALR